MTVSRIDGPAAGSVHHCRTVAVIPAYNEERFIGSVVLRAREHADIVIVVDDGSTDATARVAEAAGAQVVRHPCNRGKGVALNTGLARAWELCPQAVVTLDADGQHRADEIGRLLAPVMAGEADLVIGSRYLGGGNGGSAVPRHRVVGHRVFTGLTNRISGTPVTDSQCGFRAFSPAAMGTIHFAANGFAVESEMQFLAQEHGLRVVEMPVTAVYQDRAKRPVITHGLLVLGGIARMMGQYRPLFFFGLGGLILLLTGLVWGILVVERFHRSGQLAIGYALLSVLLLILGLILMSTGITLHSIRALLIDLLRPIRATRR